MSGGEVRIRYRRPPDRVRIFRQRVLEDAGEYVVTFLPAAELPRPVRVAGRTVLEDGAPIVWFTYRGEVWHDVGRFHLPDGTFTGLYANVLTPVRMEDGAWETTDLFLDLWLGADGVLEVLDRDELDAALAAGHLDAATAARAVDEAERLYAAAAAGAWPPAHVGEWTLERALAIFPPPPAAPVP